MVEYKKGVENRVVDALSRKDGWEEEITLSLLSIPTASWVDELIQQYLEDGKLQQLMERWHRNDIDTRKFSLRAGLLLYKQKILLGSSPTIKGQVLLYVLNDPAAEHLSYDKTL